MKEEKKSRKTMRRKGVDYNENHIVFLTICTKDHRPVLSRIVGNQATKSHQSVGTGVPDGPQSPDTYPKTELTPWGAVVDTYITRLNDFYHDISVERYVIMPNHVHLLLWVKGEEDGPPLPPEDGPSRTPVPTLRTESRTVQNTVLARFVSTLKRFCNKELGTNIWQYRSYDHIIRNQRDYEEHERYILENPSRWFYDKLFVEQ